MALSEEDFFDLGNLYVAYRKAKAEAFYENTHFHAVAYTKYEQSLDSNLKRLRARLTVRKANWFEDPAFIGGYAFLPKSIDTSEWEQKSEGHFRALDPCEDWLHRFNDTGRRAPASLRLVIRATVDFQIISSLWIMLVGHLYDSVLDRKASFGNRLRRSYREAAFGGVNLATPALFAPYFSAYREWREGGLSAMEGALNEGKSILAITMDVEQFYHRVSPDFLLKKSFLESQRIELSTAQRRFTKQLLTAIGTWYKKTPDFRTRPEGAIPVGLSASKIIANVLLADFDYAVTDKLKPIYYGRYVDDVFLVLETAEESSGGAGQVARRIAETLDPMVKVVDAGKGPLSLQLHLPYAKDSKLIFAGPKQKIFALSSAHGADLVHHIRDQIRQQSSEYRLLPSVPDTSIAMASRALLATPNAALQADALRKADVVSVRRLGFSLLLSDIETYAADLRPRSWSKIRSEFYGLVNRHVITPKGFFEFFGYVPRVFGLMLSCGDTKEAKSLVAKLSSICDLIERTTTLGEGEGTHNFAFCKQQYALALLQVGLQAATARSVDVTPGYLGVLRSIKALWKSLTVPSTVATLETLVKQMLLADWGRRPYKDYWFQDQSDDENGPKIPKTLAVRRQLRLGAIRRFRQETTDLKRPHWPALAFPTRPLRVDEISLVAPKCLSDSKLFRDAIRTIRGAEVISSDTLGFAGGNDRATVSYFVANGRPRDRVRIAVTSVGTSVEQWEAAAKGKQDRSIERYVAFNGLINRILKEKKLPDYIAFPELSIPLRWALRAARKLATNGVSLLAGVEYHRDRATRKLRNDCLVSLTTYWAGYAGSVVVLQPKFEPAHGERIELRKLTGKTDNFFKPTGGWEKPTLYAHRQFVFSVLICSDLTNIAYRRDLRGEVDAIFALEWNQDTKTFSSLVESTANDLHAFVIQANNRKYGDSRIRSPAKQDYARDVVQVKGGVSDYYVLGELDYCCRSLKTDQQIEDLLAEN
ncbi:RNA-directed DNA polymerase [Hydrocarboniphaga effusa]|uniref:Reverse transcriptase of bacterial retrotransposons protein n=1 Tax=Hydrocarboniphaga effusa AP103 TaxID=1172194 RepID=I7ZJG3_9GAMM|nr:RNA-directed DNA polymerase [Hydrocarboniphaga effusa]EIT71907.1 reverse transcriptase of bacterial retrotransposons protein [Hydrocarboniphaga effusa AP103]